MLTTKGDLYDFGRKYAYEQWTMRLGFTFALAWRGIADVEWEDAMPKALCTRD
jgi:hypothetical protein